MKYIFTCTGHKNILATHKTTLEFTKDNSLTEKGDCIIGINADFDLDKIKEFLKFDKIKITISVKDKETNKTIEETITCTPNKDFNNDKEIVIRLSDFKSDRTLGINADKAAVHLDRKLVEKMKDENSKMFITISN
tara:strand:+ start:362 stop:769 length:408 start_codon:yes stop_codon:yes gene_type:complete